MSFQSCLRHEVVLFCPLPASGLAGYFQGDSVTDFFTDADLSAVLIFQSAALDMPKSPLLPNAGRSGAPGLIPGRGAV